MKLHEYQAKDLIRKRGVLTLDSQLCFTKEELLQAVQDLSTPCVVKAQVHAGGRGKGGGVKIAHSKEEALIYFNDMMSKRLISPQTGPEGAHVSCVLVEKAADIKKEYYLAFLIDRQNNSVSLVASSEGGMDIEEVAQKNPQAITTININKAFGLFAYQARALSVSLGIDKKLQGKFSRAVMSLYRAFIECDASLLEINPLVELKDERIVALDAKLTIDDNALFRQKNISEMRDPSQEDEKEIEASQHGLSYIALDGNIACLVNGAGLAMATMDVIKHVGGSPANFLDVGGSATEERVYEALRIISSDKNVKAIFINVFGGIVKCDVIAQGLIKAHSSLNIKLPIVVRLEGTNVDVANNLLKQSGIEIITAQDLLAGAKKAVSFAS